MTSVEKKILQWIEEHLVLLFFVAVNVLGLIIRMQGIDFVSNDAKTFLFPWFDQIKQSGGIRALGNQVGNYNILYQFMIAVLTYLPFNKLLLYKSVSIAFDYVLAVGVSLLACEILKKRKKNLSTLFVMVYGAVLFLPTVIMNSSIWAQCDSIYSSFIVFSLLFLLKKRYKLAFAILGIAFAFKFQTIIIVPFFLYHYFSEKKYSILNIIITVLVFYAFCIPGFLFGRSILDPLKIYLGQTETYTQMWLCFPSFWALIGNDYETLSNIAILLTVFLLGSGLFFVLSQKIHLDEPQQFLKVAIWCVWTCLVFLPAMHDRYGYVLEILLLILFFVNKRFFAFFSIVEITSIISYGKYLFGNSMNIRVNSVFYFMSYLLFSMMLVTWYSKKKGDYLEN